RPCAPGPAATARTTPDRPGGAWVRDTDGPSGVTSTHGAAATAYDACGRRRPGPVTRVGGTVEQRSTAESGASGGTAVLSPDDFVEVSIPADGAYLSVLRTATAGLAARLDFTLDEIEDLRIAVDEACAMLLQHNLPHTSLTCRFDLAPAELAITVSAPTADGKAPAKDT